MSEENEFKVISYTLSAENSNAVLHIQKFKDATGSEFALQNNSIIIPASEGEGRIDFYELYKGIGLSIVDCYFHQPYLFKKESSKEEPHYCVAINFSDKDVTFRVDDQVVPATPNMWNIFSSSGIGTEVIVPAKSRVRLLLIKYKVDWLHNNAHTSQEDLHSIITNARLQDKIWRLLLPDIHIAIQDSIKKVLRATSVPGNTSYNEEEKRIDRLKNAIAEKLQDDLPALSDAAKDCLMSVSKFARLFKKMFGKSYADFFWDMRLIKACTLLEKGLLVKNVALLCGYSTLAAFSKAFKEKYRVSPLSYQQNRFKNIRINT